MGHCTLRTLSSELRRATYNSPGNLIIAQHLQAPAFRRHMTLLYTVMMLENMWLAVGV